MAGVKCRQCSAEIADKAIVCYKCGTATTEPVFKAPAPSRSTPRSSWIMIVVAVLLLAAFVAYTNLATPGQSPRAFSEVVIAIAVTIVVLRAIVRRRR
jgi:hypothetical protein